AGKNTMMNNVLERFEDLKQLPTATTRAIRPNEKEGREHHFVTKTQFEDMIRNDELLEHQNVHGRLYGVPRQTVADAIETERDRIADIDALGAMNVRAAFPDNTIIIFVQPGASDDVAGTIRERLRQRGETTEEIEKRLERIPLEMSYAALCDYLIINEDLDRATETLYGIILAERSRRHLLNLRARKSYPRHRVHQMSAVVVMRNNQVLTSTGEIPMMPIAPGEFPEESALRAIPKSISVEIDSVLGITTSTETHFDQLTFWYGGHAIDDESLPDEWAWTDNVATQIPVEIRNTMHTTAYSEKS
ncbi:MAG: hypothetical protein AAF125_25585, partial [Chloroflexota bacterium]